MAYKNYIDTRYLTDLETLHQEKLILKRMIDLKQPNDPFVVELSGLPRTGKTTSYEHLFDFFKKGGFSVSRIQEPAYLLKEMLSSEEISKLSDLEFNSRTLEISRNQLNKLKADGSDIVLMDRGVIDNYFWYQLYYENGKLNSELYIQYLSKLKSDLELVNKLFMLTADPKTILFRDFNSSIYLEPRKKTTLENVQNLFLAYSNLSEVVGESFENIVSIDTTNLSPRDTSIIIAKESIDAYQRKLIQHK